MLENQQDQLPSIHLPSNGLIKIEYKSKTDLEWKTLEITSSYFKRTDTYCDEWVSEELRELFYAISDDYIDGFDDLEFKAGNFWHDIVLPIYNKYVKK